MGKPSADRPVSRQGKKAITIWLDPAIWRRLRHRAVDDGETVQALGERALDLVLAMKGVDDLV
jgi:hypothetical protein